MVEARKSGRGRQPAEVEVQRRLAARSRDLQAIIQAKRNEHPARRADSLRDLVKLVTDDGAEIVAFYYAVMSGWFDGFTPAHRMEAANQLADRGFGKPVASIDIDVTSHSELNTLSNEDLIKLLAE